MADEIVKREFPDCFPSDFAKEILPQNLPDLQLEVFRVCTTGTICKETFLSTYESVLLGIIPKRRNWEKELKKPITYSVSFGDSLKDMLDTLKCLTDYHPAAFVIQGIATSELGPLQKTVDREPGIRNKSHIDWWLYKASEPSPRFIAVAVSSAEEEAEAALV